MSGVKAINDINFQDEVMYNEGPVLIQFWAEWCGPCRMLSPIIEQLSAEEAFNHIKFCKLNVDENQQTAAMFNVSSIPLLALVKQDPETKEFEAHTFLGLHPIEEVREFLTSVAGS